MQNNSFLARAAALALILIGLWLGSSFLGSIVSDRANHREAAEKSVAAGHAGQQQIMGGILQLTYEEHYYQEATEVDGSTQRKVKRPVKKTLQHYVLPKEQRIQLQVDVRQRKRGIYPVNTYASHIEQDNDWELPALSALPVSEPSTYAMKITKAVLMQTISDGRGISALQLTVGNQEISPKPQLSRLLNRPNIEFDLTNAVASGIHATDSVSLKAKLKFGLSGMNAFYFQPTAKQTAISLASNWPHTSFEGDRLPDQREANNNGSTATWKVSSLATEAPSSILALLGEPSKANLQSDASVFGIRFIDPVDVYVLSNRASKYAMFFVLLTVGSVFLFELLKRLNVHPIQYGLVGVSMLTFFLLLLSLSEHLGFAKSYLTAAIACCSLLTFYMSFVLKAWQRAVPFGIGLLTLYGALYGILQSEENALVSGAILLFVLLAVVMISTRKVDWYGLVNLAPDKQR